MAILKLLTLAVVVSLAESKKVHHVHWNKANPMFWRDNRDHVIDINVGNLPWEYDQVNLICPLDKTGKYGAEQHVIYSVSREEYDSCRITNPKPKIVAVCSQPHRLLYFTITFRSFTPTPGGLEFRPGQDYYFISTSSREDLHRRVGGACATHNMRMIFRVADNRLEQENLIEYEPTTSKPKLEEPTIVFNGKNPRLRYQQQPRNYYGYRPQQLFEVTNEIRNMPLTSSANGQKTCILGMLVLALLSLFA